MRHRAVATGLLAAFAFGGACIPTRADEDQLDSRRQASEVRTTQLQIKRPVFEQMLKRALQRRISDQCMNPIGQRFLDHIDVGNVQLDQSSSTAIAVVVPLNIFVVDRSAVLAAPNDVPAGATTPLATVNLNFELTISNGVLELKYKSLDLAVIAALVNDSDRADLESQVKSSIGVLPTMDLNPFVAELSSGASFNTLTLTGAYIAIGTDASSSADRLDISQSWGLFMGGANVEQMAAEALLSLQDKPPPGITITSTAHWRPVGTLPRVEFEIRGRRGLPDPFPGYADLVINARSDFSVVNGSALRSTIHWDISNIEIHSNVGGILEAGAEALAEEIVIPEIQNQVKAAFDPSEFGATRIDDNTFYTDKPLKPFGFSGSSFRYDSLIATPEGMTLGGAVWLPEDPGLETVDPTIGGFRGQLDSLAAFGCPPPIAAVRRGATIDKVSATAGIGVSGLGRAKVCSFEYIPEDDLLRSLTTINEDKTAVSVTLPGELLAVYTQPIQLLLKTTRGVRLFNLGAPPQPAVDDNGVVTNAVVEGIDTCKYVDPEWWKGPPGSRVIDIITTQPGIDDGPGIPPIDGGGGVVKRPGGVVHRPSGAANAPAVLGVSVAR